MDDKRVQRCGSGMTLTGFGYGSDPLANKDKLSIGVKKLIKYREKEIRLKLKKGFFLFIF